MNELMTGKLPFSLNNKRVHNSLLSVEDPSNHLAFPQIFVEFPLVLCLYDLSPSDSH